MADSIFTTAPDTAYSMLEVIPPGQRWCAFDKNISQARRGNATKFVMTVWNLYTKPKSDDISELAIKRDRKTKTFWYRVARLKDSKSEGNRTHLWNSLHIAASNELPMRAMLKDRTTKLCALDYVFDIQEVLFEEKDQVLWMRLDVPQSGPGTAVEDFDLPVLKDIAETINEVSKRSPKISAPQYEAACELAAKVQTGGSKRQDAIRELVAVHGMTEGSASSLLNNYRCMVEGNRFVAPMSADAIRHFADRIVASGGTDSLPQVISALQGYLQYARSNLKNPAHQIAVIIDELKNSFVDGRAVEALVKPSIIDTAEGGTKNLVSEILREVWIRGPMHAAFKRELERRWSHSCAVHGAACNGQLRASHIVAWRLDTTLRGDVNNGLLLSVPLDSLFDSGLITFAEDGRLMKSVALEDQTCHLFALRPDLRLAWDHLREQSREAVRENLAKHRSYHAKREPYQVY